MGYFIAKDIAANVVAFTAWMWRNKRFTIPALIALIVYGYFKLDGEDLKWSYLNFFFGIALLIGINVIWLIVARAVFRTAKGGYKAAKGGVKAVGAAKGFSAYDETIGKGVVLVRSVSELMCCGDVVPEPRVVHLSLIEAKRLGKERYEELRRIGNLEEITSDGFRNAFEHENWSPFINNIDEWGRAYEKYIVQNPNSNIAQNAAYIADAITVIDKMFDIVRIVNESDPVSHIYDKYDELYDELCNYHYSVMEMQAIPTADQKFEIMDYSGAISTLKELRDRIMEMDKGLVIVAGLLTARIDKFGNLNYWKPGE